MHGCCQQDNGSNYMLLFSLGRLNPTLTLVYINKGKL